MHVELRLTELLDDGGSGFVYAATAVESDSDDSRSYLPPLVVKMARRSRRGHIAREAWFYDELHELQGSVIPRCYGWFEALQTAEFSGNMYAPDSDDDEYEGKPSYYPEPWSPELDELASHKDYISVLVLERLGSKIPMNVPLSSELR